MRRGRHRLNGALLVDKPAGWTSHDVVAVTRRHAGTRSVGHTGTLDPFATGLLVVMVGKATRLARYVESLAKEYEAVIQLGTATDTDDPTGTVTGESTGPWPDEATVREVLGRHVGRQWQRPPVFSAKHVGGERSHRLARAGQAVVLEAVQVQVHQLELVTYTAPDVTVRAVVGRGTYLRSLARDVGEALGMPAHCAALRRTRSGSFDVRDAVTPDRLGDARLIEPAEAVAHLPRVVLDDGALVAVGHGRAVACDPALGGTVAMVSATGRLVAIAEAADGRCQPDVVLEPAA